MAKIELIIFDLDGTLIDSRVDIAKAVNYTLNELNVKIRTEDEIASFIGRGVLNLLEQSLGPENLQLADKALPIFKAYFKDHAFESTRLYPGAKEVLDWLGRRKKAVITNRYSESCVTALEKFKLSGYFAHVLGGDNGDCIKPSGCPIQETMKLLKAGQKNTLMVGDMDVDILAGRDAGVPTVGVTYGIGKKEELISANPDYIIDDISELKKIVDTYEGNK